MNDYKELVDQLKLYADTAEDMIYGICVNAPEAMKDAADAIEQLSTKCRQLEKERDAAVNDLEKCMYYAQPKNNNVCNFCKKDMSEYPDKCNGWSDFCECEPEWRGAQDDK